jgi:predicted HTH transcriptional regulator
MPKSEIQIPKYLQMRIAEGEHQQLDFKYVINDSKKIAITLCAFANTDGGTLLIGVKDNGSIAGAKLEEEIHMVEAAANMYCKPSIEIKTQGWRAGERYVLEVMVEPSRYRPHQALDDEGNWKAYLRRHDQNFPAPGVLMQFWKSEHTPMTEKYFHTEKEKKLFEALNNTEGYTVSQLSRITNIPRQIVTTLLARFMRWELVKMDFDQGVARFKSN